MNFFESANPQLHYYAPHLSVDVAERTSKRVASVANRHCRHTNIPKVESIIKCCISARGLVIDGDGTLHAVLSLGNVEILPCPVCTIDHSMVKVESWVARASEKVTSRVTTDSEVARGMYSQETVGEIALHDGRKPVEVGVVLN